MREFRYFDEARTFGESLAEIKVAEPKAPEPNLGALQRILDGDTALGKMAEHAPHSVAAAPQDLQKHELKKKLEALMAKKTEKTATAQRGVLAFCERAEKLANPSFAPDISPSQMTSGNGEPAHGAAVSGASTAPKETISTRDQGPAADLIARSLKHMHAKDKRHKVAASRLDKEVALGNVGYHNVDAAVPASMGSSGLGKRIARHNAFQPAAVAPEVEGRLQRLDASVTNNQHLLADRARAAKANRPVGAGLATGLQALLGAPPGQDLHASNSLARQETLQSQLHNKHVPGMGPATMQQPFAGITVNAPQTSGQFMRSASSGPLGMMRASAGTVAPQLLPSAQPVDASLNRAVLEHELGERGAMLSGKYHMHASHLGTEPTLRENIAMQGRPQAQAVMAKARAMHPDDALLARMTRQAGGTPNSPIPLDSRRSRGLDRMLESRSGDLAKATKQRTLQMATMQSIADPVAAERFRTVPSGLRNEIASFGSNLRALPDALPRASAGVLEKARGMVGVAKPLVGNIMRIGRFKW